MFHWVKDRGYDGQLPPYISLLALGQQLLFFYVHGPLSELNKLNKEKKTELIIKRCGAV